MLPLEVSSLIGSLAGIGEIARETLRRPGGQAGRRAGGQAPAPDKPA